MSERQRERERDRQRQRQRDRAGRNRETEQVGDILINKDTERMKSQRKRIPVRRDRDRPRTPQKDVESLIIEYNYPGKRSP